MLPASWILCLAAIEWMRFLDLIILFLFYFLNSWIHI